jgi:hypothetical protein
MATRSEEFRANEQRKSARKSQGTRATRPHQARRPAGKAIAREEARLEEGDLRARANGRGETPLPEVDAQERESSQARRELQCGRRAPEVVA